MRTRLIGASVALFMSGTAYAQAPAPDNLEKLSNFQSTGTSEFTRIEQSGDYADGIKKTLERITLPDGFKISLYSVVPYARHIPFCPQLVVSFFGTL